MTPLTRRVFLSQSLTAAAAAAVLPGCTGRKLVSANERLSVAVIGVRGRGQSHVRAFSSREDCQVTYVCDADRDVGGPSAERLGRQFGRRPKFVEDMRRIFDDPSVDIVSIATPNHWHALAAIWAMQAGKDVYLEKPVSHNIHEGRVLVQASRKYERICQAGTQKRSLLSNQQAAQYVAAGKLGEIRLAHCSTYRLRKPIGPAGSHPVPASVNYDLWAGPASAATVVRSQFHYDWHWFWDYGNGEIGNNSIHRVDIARMIVGLEGLGRGVMCYGGRVKFRDCGQTANVQVAIHDFGPVTLIQEVRNLPTPPPARGDLYVLGTQGYLVGNDQGNTVFDLQGKQVAHFAAQAGTEVTLSAGKYRDDFAGLDDAHIDNFVRAVRSRRRALQAAEIRQGHCSTALCHLANISYRLGRPAAGAEILEKLNALKLHSGVGETLASIRSHLAENQVDLAHERLVLGPWLSIAPATDRFVGNPAADALLARQYRQPFNLPKLEAPAVSEPEFVPFAGTHTQRTDHSV
jgi:predicted dehydrogenase